MIHYGYSKALCGESDVPSTDEVKEEIRATNCPGCLLAYFRATDDRTVSYYDRDNERYVIEPVKYAYVLWLDKSRQCVVRGTFETYDGSLYVFTIRRKGHADEITFKGRELYFVAAQIVKRGERPNYNLEMLTGDFLRMEEQFMTDVDKQRVGRQVWESTNTARQTAV